MAGRAVQAAQAVPALRRHKHYKVLVVGGGPGGLSVASSLAEENAKGAVSDGGAFVSFCFLSLSSRLTLCDLCRPCSSPCLLSSVLFLLLLHSRSPSLLRSSRGLSSPCFPILWR